MVVSTTQCSLTCHRIPDHHCLCMVLGCFLHMGTLCSEGQHVSTAVCGAFPSVKVRLSSLRPGQFFAFGVSLSPAPEGGEKLASYSSPPGVAWLLPRAPRWGCWPSLLVNHFGGWSGRAGSLPCFRLLEAGLAGFLPLLSHPPAVFPHLTS
jgi:hypothetical protein